MKPEIKYYFFGRKEFETWWYEGKIHRLDGPARIRWYRNGNKQFENWYVNGKQHRIDGPAYTKWYKDGTIKSEEWHVNGVDITSIINQLGFTTPLNKEQLMQLRMIID